MSCTTFSPADGADESRRNVQIDLTGTCSYYLRTSDPTIVPLYPIDDSPQFDCFLEEFCAKSLFDVQGNTNLSL